MHVLLNKMALQMKLYFFKATHETTKLQNSDGLVHCSVKNAAVLCENHCERLTQIWTSPSEEEEDEGEERKTFWPSGDSGLVLSRCFLAVITPYRSSSSVFMTNNTPSGAKKLAVLEFLRNLFVLALLIFRVRTIPTYKVYRLYDISPQSDSEATNFISQLFLAYYYTCG